LPKRRTVIRAFLCSVLLLMPFLTLASIKAPHVMVPFWIGVATLVYYSGVLSDVAKQLRWMRRMSSQGPIFWIGARVQRLWVRLLRAVYGDKMDRPPGTPTQIGLTYRTSKAATIKWHPAPRSIYSSEKYELQMRLSDPEIVELIKQSDKGEELADWISLDSKLEPSELKAAPLQPDTAYEARVRAVNSRGASDWVTVGFHTKQTAVDGGGSGPGYTWKQHTKDDTLTLVVPVPAGTRGKQVGVHVMPTTLKLTLNDEPLVEGGLFGTVKSSDIEWEMVEEGGGGKQVVLTLAKTEKDKPFWPQLISGHPEVDVRGLKRDPKELEELLAESNLGEMMGPGGPPPLEQMMAMKGLGGMKGM